MSTSSFYNQESVFLQRAARNSDIFSVSWLWSCWKPCLCLHAENVSRTLWMHTVDGGGVRHGSRRNYSIMSLCWNALSTCFICVSPPDCQLHPLLTAQTAARPSGLSNVPCWINDTISPAALRSLLLMWFHRDVNAPLHSFPSACLWLSLLNTHVSLFSVSTDQTAEYYIRDHTLQIINFAPPFFLGHT